MGYKLMYSRQAEKDARTLEQNGLDRKAKELLAVIGRNPFQSPPPHEKLVETWPGHIPAGSIFITVWFIRYTTTRDS